METGSDVSGTPHASTDPASTSSEPPARWQIWRGSPDLLAHVVRVAERASGGTETTIDVAVAEDHEIFSSAKDFVDGVTVDALRNFSSISITTGGLQMRIVILLRWIPREPFGFSLGDVLSSAWESEAEVAVTAAGVDAAGEREALLAVHNAIKRGGTDGTGRRRAFLLATQFAGVIGIYAAWTATIDLAPEPFLPGPLMDHDSVLLIAAGMLTSLVLGLAIGRWAYPALEVADRGETRLWRVARWFGGVAVSLAVGVLLKVAVHG